ncbi:MAG: helix-turn-helix domain-containing protein [Gemmatimonadaceae bacterium]
MKVPEVADLCEVDPETVRVWVREGKLKARRNPGGRVLVFVRSEVESALGLLNAPQNDNEPASAETPDEP